GALEKSAHLASRSQDGATVDHLPEPDPETADRFGAEVVLAERREVSGVVHGVQVTAGPLVADDVGRGQRAEPPGSKLRPHARLETVVGHGHDATCPAATAVSAAGGSSALGGFRYAEV